MNKYEDFLGDLLAVVNENIDCKINAIQKGQICKVVSTDGFYVSVNTLNYKGEVFEGDFVIKGVPILQSPKLSLPIKKDDLGILLNIQIDLSNIIENKEYFTDIEHDFYVFMPIVAKANFKSNADDFYVSSNEGDTTLILNDKEAKLNTKGDLSIKSSGTNTVEFGNSAGTLKTAFDAIFQAMDLIASGMTGTTTNPGAYNGGKTALQQQIAQIFK